MSFMSQKDIDERNAAHKDCEVEYADKHCAECGMPYWTGVKDDDDRGFCCESCLELYHKDEEMDEWRKQEDKEEYLFDFLGLNERRKVELIRNGRTGILR